MGENYLRKLVKRNERLWEELIYAKSRFYTSLNRRQILPYTKSLKKFYNIHEGERCFIVANGPSLTMSDLDRISKEITFGCNRIYGVYPNTVWRPTYYTTQDMLLLQDNIKVMQESCFESKNCFYPINFSNMYPDEVMQDPKNYFYYMDLRPFGTSGLHFIHGDYPKFSKDVSKKIYEGYTVSYAMIQLAIYMGFKDIYLIGFDHTANAKNNQDGTTDEEKIKSNYVKGIAPLGGNKANNSKMYETTNAYRMARKYAEKHGVHIWNATRGGQLEVFDRVLLDDVLEGDIR